MDKDIISASDALAISMLGVIFLAMAVIALLFLCMRRNASRRDQHVDDLFDEMEEDERKAEVARSNPEKKPDAPWEKDGEWWKK